jgi:hypothetical protein
MSFRRWAIAVVLLALLGASRSAHAQEAADDFDQLRFVIAPGSTIQVVEASGATVKATFLGARGDSLDLLVRGARQSVARDDVVRIRQRRDDSLANGARNGLIAGAALGLLGGMAIANEGGSAAVYIPVVTAVYGGIGAGIGVGIDALIKGERTVYEARARHASLSIAPVVDRERKGVAVSLGF